MWAGETLLAAACPNFCLQGGGKGLSMLYSLLQGQFSCCLKGSSGTRHCVLLPRAMPAKRPKSITPKFRLSVASCPKILFLPTLSANASRYLSAIAVQYAWHTGFSAWEIPDRSVLRVSLVIRAPAHTLSLLCFPCCPGNIRSDSQSLVPTLRAFKSMDWRYLKDCLELLE